MPVATLRPNSLVGSGSWTGTIPGNVADASDASAVFITDGNDAFSVGFANLPSSAATVVSPITVNMRYSRSSGSAATPNSYVTWSGNTAYGGAQGNTSITTHAYSQSRPSGGSYSVADINSQTGGVLAASGISSEELYVYDIWWNVTWDPSSGGFAFLISSLAGAALGLAEMPRLAAEVFRRTGNLILRSEYGRAHREFTSWTRPSFCML